jgi:glycine/serine hydroxymethyltransferase
MEQIAELIHRALARVGDEPALAGVADDVRALCARFPVYRSRLA